MYKTNYAEEPRLVSIVMPAYNAEAHISESIQSVIGQSLHNWELIIVDNCSTDSTLKIANSFQLHYSNIRVYSVESNSGGPAYPRNIGVRKSKGKYVAFIDSDDIWDINKLSDQLPHLGKFNLVCSLSDKIDDDGNLVKSSRCTKNKELDVCSVIYRNSIINSSVIVHRELFLSVLFDEDKLLIGLEDYNAYIRYLALYGNAFMVGKPLVKYRVSMLSLGSAITGEKRLVLSLYCLTKSIINTSAYQCVVKGILIRIRSYVKYKFLAYFAR